MVLVILICLVQIILHFLVSFCLPEPFADEVSHVPQAMKYLEGKYKTWNPMITTPPGLYIASVALLYPLKRMGLYKSKRATIFFRIINPMMSILFLLLSDTDKLWKNTIILLIPILYPYTHLFYTDVASMLLVHISSQFYFSREYYKSALV